MRLSANRSWCFCISSIQIIFSRSVVFKPKSKEYNSAPSNEDHFQGGWFANSGFMFRMERFFKILQITLILQKILGPLHFQKHFKSYDTRIDPRSNRLLDSSTYSSDKAEVSRAVSFNPEGISTASKQGTSSISIKNEIESPRIFPTAFL